MTIATVLIFGVDVLASVAMGQVGVKADDLTSSLVSAKSTTGENSSRSTDPHEDYDSKKEKDCGDLIKKHDDCDYDYGKRHDGYGYAMTEVAVSTENYYNKHEGYDHDDYDCKGYGSGYSYGYKSYGDDCIVLRKDSATENTDAATTENGSKTKSKTKSSKEAKSSATNKPKHK
ncbi:hypothetical protein F443_13254 [Phytophthora nicotianae P1569]|uniref:Secreted protein n=1 Tax=Phytophthora nicotianae P1569 TaxID=1317065 RepID=V9ERQ1_PHYNI|nr:hypothetical protein F443_13254 [Phytophthora nicotianae P1569]